jgi:predicted TIM-barrel fold metal-dependent hydrolase
MFPPVEEIYDRYDPAFRDTHAWRERRRRANEYLLDLGDRDLRVHPFLFLWNDFAVDQLRPVHKGIKWHRHSDEPEYAYDDPECARAVRIIRELDLPVLLEEEPGNTVRFIREIAPNVRVIIPHLGALNGGFEVLARHGLWEMERVHADTSLAGKPEIREYVRRYGSSRLLFGSDFPFGDPGAELRKLRDCSLPPGVEEAVLRENMPRVLGEGTGVRGDDRQV